MAKARKFCQYTEIREGKAIPLWRLTPYNPLRALSGEAASATSNTLVSNSVITIMLTSRLLSASSKPKSQSTQIC